MSVLSRGLVLGLALLLFGGLASPMFAEPDCGCCGGSCDAGCCMLAALGGFAIGHPTAERPHWKPPLEIRAELPCVVGSAVAGLSPPTSAGDEQIPVRTVSRWARAEDTPLLGLSPAITPAAPRGPPSPPA